MDNKRFEPTTARDAKAAASTPRATANTVNQVVPRDVLGIPGAYYQLWVHNVKRGEDPHSTFHSQQDKYRVVFTLSRHPLDKQNLDFKGAGDSFIQIAKPEGERTENDADRVVIFSSHITETGVEKLEVEGIPNKEGRLAQCVVELPAPSFAEADRIAFGAVSGFFSTLAFEIDVPVRLGQLNIEQTSTQNASMTYTCPYPDVHLTAAGTDLSQNPYVQSLLSLYREGINSNSMNYQFLCWYKVVEGIFQHFQHLSLTCPFHPRRIRHKWSAKSSRTTASSRNLVAAGCVWSTRARTPSLAGSRYNPRRCVRSAS
ncbi:MAG: methylamine utilization protein MauJ [Candidatus Acidiferrum sp.]